MPNKLTVGAKTAEPVTEEYGTLWIHRDYEYEEDPEVHMFCKTHCPFPAMISLETGISYNDPLKESPGIEDFTRLLGPLTINQQEDATKTATDSYDSYDDYVNSYTD